ncbi:MAG: type IV pili methyl-accepting chemotaxis transducer N-terminal domain-containing protein [Pseudomonadota bacterium]
MINRRAAILGGLSVVVLASTPISAQSAGTAIGRKVNVAGRQRMLSQRIAMASAMGRLGVEPQENLDIIRSASRDFDTAQQALRNGSDEFGLLEETHPSVLSALNKVDVAWAEMGDAATSIVNQGAVSRANFRSIAEVNLKLLSRSNIVVKKIVSAYSEDDRSDVGLAVAIDIAGRQRMLSQKMIKEAALIGLKYRKSDNREFLNETLEEFDSSLFKLMYGAADEDIPEAPPEVLSKLQQVESLWLDIFPLMDEIASLGRADSFELEELSASALDLLSLSNEAVQLYERAWAA